MSIFSRLFSSSTSSNNSSDSNFDYIKSLLHDKAEFYSQVQLLHKSYEKTIPYMMIHKDLGLVLFSFFDFSASELKGVSASKADEGSKDADIKTLDDKQFIRNRFEETFHTQIAPVLSILVCPRLSESEFDKLDKSFHELIPKEAALFSNNNNAQSLNSLIDNKHNYDVDKIKQALFSELIVPQTNTLMSKEQQEVIHLDLEQKQSVLGLPGSGKSAVLIAKALYEKRKNPSLKLIVFAKRACNVHFLQSLIFKFVENSNWAINPADIVVSSFDSLQRRSREKEKFELVICDNINEDDLGILNSLLSPQGKLLVSSNHSINDLKHYDLGESFRLHPSVSAACEGLHVDALENYLKFEDGNIFMKTMLVLENLIKEVPLHEISIIHHNKDESLRLQSEINEYFEPIAYLYDDIDQDEGILIYPLSHLACIINDYVIIIIDDESDYDVIELISRAKVKSFILSSSKDVHNTLNQITKDTNNESN